MKPIKGQKYSPEEIEKFVEQMSGWTTDTGEAPGGYNVYDYFYDGVYLGPDLDGIEPIW